MADTFSINKVYNFDTLAPAILGNDYQSMKVKAMMSSNEAIKYRDIYTLHNNLLPVITGLPQNLEDCVYILFENQDKEEMVLALEYIDPFTIKEVITTNIRIEVFDTNTEDLSVLRSRLLELGYNDFKISTF